MVAGFSVLAAALLARTSLSVEGVPYAPLNLYDGNWEVKVSVPKPQVDHIVNHCAQTGLFYLCEQVVNGKTSALLVFLPVAKTSIGWGRLVIDRDMWGYSWDSGDDKKIVHWRVKTSPEKKDSL